MFCITTLAQLAIAFIFSPLVFAKGPVDVRVKGDLSPKFEKTSRYSLFFDPAENGIKLEQQKIDYNLSRETVLSLGPFLLDQSAVSMQMTREQGEFTELEFGLELRKKRGPIYVVSFSWPLEYVSSGTIEIINDKAESLWRKEITDNEIADWDQILKEQNNKALFEKNRENELKQLEAAKDRVDLDKIREKLNLAKPRSLSRVHHLSQYGLAHKQFFEVPIAQIKSPFRFCVTDDNEKGRLAICSQRYEFSRSAGRYSLRSVNSPNVANVYINDKLVTLKGTAIFLDNKVPIKFAASLKNGTYFEFVANPKEVKIVDVVASPKGDYAQVIGFGDRPLGLINESFYADSVHYGLLNFLPTIGDLRKFWAANITRDSPFLYLKGDGGAPFRQTFTFSDLPTSLARITLSNKTTKSTYGSKVWINGTVNPKIKVSAKQTEVERLTETEFRWNFQAPKKGVYNTDTLLVGEGDKTWKANYEIYRGYSTELSFRLSGVLTNGFDFILLSEISGQYWVENLFGLQNYYLSQQRWGVAARYWKAFLGTDQVLKTLAVENVDLKYRFSPGVWGRDPTVGLILSHMSINYGLDVDAERFEIDIPVAGGGIFWARSMPRFFDDLFNIVPFLRYPKWVDWEVLFYPFALQPNQASRSMFAMNFHGKVEWTSHFFGEAGFGLKNFSFEDRSDDDETRHLSTTVGVIYGTVGLGFNF